MSRSELVQMRMGIKQCPFPHGMADWFIREPNYILNADLPAGFYTNCTFINCTFVSAVVQNSDVSECKFDKATVMYCQITGQMSFGNLNVEGDLTVSSSGTITADPTSYVGVVPSFSMEPRKSKRKSKLPKKLEKGWK